MCSERAPPPRVGESSGKEVPAQSSPHPTFLAYVHVCALQRHHVHIARVPPPRFGKGQGPSPTHTISPPRPKKETKYGLRLQVGRTKGPTKPTALSRWCPGYKPERIPKGERPI
ncbi:hypothetical protein N9L68_09035, partial [bacterium]|nr:hypothetical protein [bacterium]